MEENLDQPCARLIGLAKVFGSRHNLTVLMALCATHQGLRQVAQGDGYRSC
jgi:hypothetical protein